MDLLHVNGHNDRITHGLTFWSVFWLYCYGNSRHRSQLSP